MSESEDKKTADAKRENCVFSLPYEIYWNVFLFLPNSFFWKYKKIFNKDSKSEIISKIFENENFVREKVTKIETFKVKGGIDKLSVDDCERFFKFVSIYHDLHGKREQLKKKPVVLSSDPSEWIDFFAGPFRTYTHYTPMIDCLKAVLRASLCVMSFPSQSSDGIHHPEIETKENEELILNPIHLNFSRCNVLVEPSINSVRISFYWRKSDEIEEYSVKLMTKFYMNRADKFGILRRKALKGFDLSFLITHKHVEEMYRDKIVHFLIEMYVGIDTDIMSFKIDQNQRGRVFAKKYLRHLGGLPTNVQIISDGCFSKEMKVKTKSSTPRIADVNTSQFIESSKGKFSKVMSVVRHKSRRIVLNINDGLIKITPDHLIFCKLGSSNKIRLIPSRKLKIGDYLLKNDSFLKIDKIIQELDEVCNVYTESGKLVVNGIKCSCFSSKTDKFFHKLRRLSFILFGKKNRKVERSFSNFVKKFRCKKQK